MNGCLIVLFPSCVPLTVSHFPVQPTAGGCAGLVQEAPSFWGRVETFLWTFSQSIGTASCHTFSHEPADLMSWRSKTPDRFANAVNRLQDTGSFIITSVTKALIKNKCCFQPRGSHWMMFKVDSDNIWKVPWALCSGCVVSKANRMFDKTVGCRISYLLCYRIDNTLIQKYSFHGHVKLAIVGWGFLNCSL